MNMIKISLDVTKLDKTKFYKGKKGTYANLTIVETPDNEFSSHVVFQDLGKDDKGEWIKSDIVGSAKRWKDEEAKTDTNDDLPF